MPLHIMAVAKLKLIVAGGHTNMHLLSALLGFFVLKLPMATHLPRSLTGVTRSLRLFLFRLNRILFHDSPAQSNQRWSRALRLIQERTVIDNRADIAWADGDALRVASMMVL